MGAGLFQCWTLARESVQVQASREGMCTKLSVLLNSFHWLFGFRAVALVRLVSFSL